MIKNINKTIITKLFFIKDGLLVINQPNEDKIYIGDKDSNLVANLNIHSQNLFKRIMKSGAIGFSEAYINSEISSPDISKVIFLFSLNRRHNTNIIYGKKIYNYWNYFKHTLKANSVSGSKKNISYHYDLGNKFYEKWLDKSMTYSSALFSNQNRDLISGQENKYEHICKITNIKKGDNILEIGCGWGGLAEYIAKKFQTKITCITLSNKQAEYVKKRVQKESLTDLIDVQICDYRSINKKYDKIISIEMFEAVGKKNWSQYFKIINKSLKDGGTAVLQIITIDEDLYSEYQYKKDFIQKYIFPGGMLPTKKMLQKLAVSNKLRLKEKKSFGQDYAKTLNIWRKNFSKNWEEIEKMGFDIQFKRLWEYYLCYCEVGFEAGTIDVSQFLIEKKLV